MQPLLDCVQIDPSGWDGFLGPLATAKSITATNPSWTDFMEGISGWLFSATALNEMWVTFHIDHTWKAGTAIYLHVHWALNGVAAGIVRWGIEYTVAKGYNRQAFGATTTVFIEQAVTGVFIQHMIAEASIENVIPTAALEPDCLILARIFRDAAHANDTCTDGAFAYSCDLHCQKRAIVHP